MKFGSLPERRMFFQSGCFVLPWLLLGTFIFISDVFAVDEDFNARVSNSAKVARRGAYPREFLGDAVYWTVAGADGTQREALLGEDGAVEADRGGFRIEPFLSNGGRTLAWSDVSREAFLEADVLPVTRWKLEGLSLEISPFGAAGAGDETIYIRYRMRNEGIKSRQMTLWLAARPFQVLPPWQTLNLTGGFSPIRSVRRDGNTLSVDDATLRVWPQATRFVALEAQPGALVERLGGKRGLRKREVKSASGEASAALGFDMKLAAGETREVCLAWTSGEGSLPVSNPCPEIRAGVLETWREKLNRARIRAPAAPMHLDTLRTALAHILIHRDGALLQPGSRTYARVWIRDAALMAEALLKLGHAGEARDFLRAYAAYPFENGGIPCCVDARGADPTPEHDSEGEFIFAAAEYFRFTRDMAFLRELWPRAARAAQRIDALRRRRLTPEFSQPDKRKFYGLLPESISHEGYAKQAVHSYWDDFWAYKGLADAAWLAAELGEHETAHEFAAWRDAFRTDLLASIGTVMAEKGLKTIPASADLGDFDPTATAIAFAPTGLAADLPREALRQTYAEYAAHLARRRGGQVQEEAYTPYEIRNAGAFLRLGQRDRALELLDSMLEGRRPAGWRQWPEIVWTDGKMGKFLGDLPHGWIGAEYIRAVRDLFAYENGDALVLAAGLPAVWLEGEGVAVENLPTHFGLLSYRLWREPGGALRLQVAGGLRVPPGGVRVRPPRGGAFADAPANDTVINSLPADVVIAAPL